MTGRRAFAGWLAAAVLSLVVYGTAVQRLSSIVRPAASPELLVALPRFAQVLLAAGDRYLAANLAGFRVLVSATDGVSAEHFAVMGRLQRDIAWFNPAHEDNYYIAAAILPWNGQLDAAQDVLRRAADARRTDWLPLFYLGFHAYHFARDPATGAQYLLAGVPRAAVTQDRMALQNLAAIWIEKGYDTGNAASMVESMAANSPPGNFRRYLAVRAARLRDLAALRDSARIYRDRFGRRLQKLDDLVTSGLLAELPKDPLGLGFDLDVSGRPVLNTSPSQERK